MIPTYSRNKGCCNHLLSISINLHDTDFPLSVGVIRHPTVSCDIPIDQLDNPNFHCNAVTWNKLNQITTTDTNEECIHASQHECINAFTNIEIGDPIHKIFGAVPTDTMQSVRKGFMSHGTSIIFDCMTKKSSL
jgi:hypothetical protein